MNKILLGVSGKVFAFLVKGTSMVYVNFSFFLSASNMNVMDGAAVAIF